jgi:acetyl-CoA carboxylase beta subunit
MPVTQEQFKLRIKTARENAVVLLGKGRASQDELRLEIKDSRFVMTSSGKGQGERQGKSDFIITFDGFVETRRIILGILKLSHF